MSFYVLLSDQVLFFLMTSSCSFRITRTAEDLAQTITALSQRLVKLEQRQEFLEMQLNNKDQQPPEEEMAILDSVEQLMKECQELLESSEHSNDNDQSWKIDEATSIAA